MLWPESVFAAILVKSLILILAVALILYVLKTLGYGHPWDKVVIVIAVCIAILWMIPFLR